MISIIWVFMSELVISRSYSNFVRFYFSSNFWRSYRDITNGNRLMTSYMTMYSEYNNAHDYDNLEFNLSIETMHPHYIMYFSDRGQCCSTFFFS